MAQLWHDNPAEYGRLVAERHQRWADQRGRQDESIDAADLLRQESYGTDPIDDA